MHKTVDITSRSIERGKGLQTGINAPVFSRISVCLAVAGAYAVNFVAREAQLSSV
jgi:hypothetical protein